MRASQPSAASHSLTCFSSVSHSVPSKSPLTSAIASARIRRSPAAQHHQVSNVPPSLPSKLAHVSPLSRPDDGVDGMGSELGSSVPDRGGGDEYEDDDSTPSPSLASLAQAARAGGSDSFDEETNHHSHRNAPSVSSTGSNTSPAPSDTSPPATPLCTFTPLASSNLTATAADFTSTAQQPPQPLRMSRRRSNPRLRHDVPLRLPAVPDRLHHFTLYETKQRWYLVGSNLTRTQHRLLKIDRTTLTSLSINEDYTTYTTSELDSVLHMIHTGNAASGGVLSVRHCPAVIGFVRFLMGYYLYVVTSAIEVGRLGAHIVYAVTGVELLQVADSAVWEAAGAFKRSRTNEAKYKALFLSLDVTKYFYFSHTYQLTRTLQLNMIAGGEGRTGDREKDMYVWNQCMRLKPLSTAVSSSKQPSTDPLVMELDRSDWCIHLLHGFFEQCTLSILGRPLTLTLISRRSRHYAGTRYLKRGINSRGHAANDVETEQILHDRSQGSAREGAYTAYVTMRASIPVHWTQESNAIIAQPAIVMQKLDPLHLSTRRHVEDVWRRYGSPLLVLNLVKQTEARKRESIIGAAFGEAVEWLNVWLEAQHKVDYHAWDFKKISKSSTLSLMDELTVIAHWALQRTGLFHSHPKSDARRVRASDTAGLKPTRESLREWGVDGLPTRKADKKRRADGLSGQKVREAEMWERNGDSNSGREEREEREERKDVLFAASTAEHSGSQTPMSAPFVLSSIREDGSRTDDSPLSRTAHTAHSAHHSRHVSDDSDGFSLSSLVAASPSPSNLASSSSFSSPSSHTSTRPARNVAFLQRGVCRGNCVDSLDRTNAALYAVGKVALGYQLHALSLIPSPVADNFGAIGSVLLDMYERMGDAIALQYGGSQMHRQVRKDQNNTNSAQLNPPLPLNKTVPVLFSSLSLKSAHKPAELLTSIVRHYHNSFQDVSKQDAINLFLGLYRPWERGKMQQGELWDLQSDYYLHNGRDEEREEDDEGHREPEEAKIWAEDDEVEEEHEGEEEQGEVEEEEMEEEVEEDVEMPVPQTDNDIAEAKRWRKRGKDDRLVRYEDDRWWKQPIEENEKLLGPFALPTEQLFSSTRSGCLSSTSLTSAKLLENHQPFQRSISSPIPSFLSPSLLPSSSTASTLPAVSSSLSDSSTSSSGADGLTPLAPSLSWVLSYGPLTSLTEFDTLLAAQGLRGALQSITILGVDNSAHDQQGGASKAAKPSEAADRAAKQSEGGLQSRKSRRRGNSSQPPSSPISPARAEWEAQQSALREAYERRRKEAMYSLDSSYALCRASPTVTIDVAAAYERYVKRRVESFLVPESSVSDSEWMVANWRKEKQDAREAAKRRAREKADDRRQRKERQTAALAAAHSSAAASIIVKERIGTAGLALAARKVSLAETDDGKPSRLPRLTSFVVVTQDGQAAADDDDEQLMRTAPARYHQLTPPHSNEPSARTDRQHSVIVRQQQHDGGRELLPSPLSDSSATATSPSAEIVDAAVDDADMWSGELSLPLSATQLSLFRAYVAYCTTHLRPSLWRACFAAHFQNKPIDHTDLHSVSDRQYREAEQDVYRKFLSLS